MKKRIIVIAVAIVAIALIAYFGIGKRVIDKYTYGTEKADLAAYFGTSGDELAIVLGDRILADKAVKGDGYCYFEFATVEDYIGDGFYYDPAYNGGTLMFTTADGTIEAPVGSSKYGFDGEGADLGHRTCYLEGNTLYIASDYVSQYFSINVNVYDEHVLLVTKGLSGTNTMITTSATQIREKGGIKSPILREVEEGETVLLIETMEEWSKVETSDGYIGYIENKRMGVTDGIMWGIVNEVTVPQTEFLSINERVVLGFNSIAGAAGNDTLGAAIEEGQGMNVIAPTWFSLSDNLGGIRNFGSTAYVEKAHENGIRVWAVLDDFNYRLDNDADISDVAILSDTNVRRTLISNVVSAASELGVDGINIDFEKLNDDCYEHYAQFIKELSVATHERGLVLSFDNYVPFNFNKFTRIDVQGKFADYVLIMGYDEHYHGSGDIGSVASFDYICYGLDKTLESVNAERIINALPFYTIVWKNDSGSVSDSYLTLINESDFINKYGISYEWDEETCQNFAQWQSGTATYYVWFEDKDSISSKLNAMNSRNIGGVGVWRLGYGTAEVWNLVAMYKDMTGTSQSGE